MKRTKPPFRADHVGSLLRPAALKEARERRAKGEISAADLKAVEDREIERVIKKQEEAGLQAEDDDQRRQRGEGQDLDRGHVGQVVAEAA